MQNGVIVAQRLVELVKPFVGESAIIVRFPRFLFRAQYAIGQRDGFIVCFFFQQQQQVFQGPVNI